jgi:hypothetical protein
MYSSSSVAAQSASLLRGCGGAAACVEADGNGAAAAIAGVAATGALGKLALGLTCLAWGRRIIGWKRRATWKKPSIFSSEYTA